MLRTHRDDPELRRSPELGWRRRTTAVEVVLSRRGDPERRRQQLDVGPAQVDLEDGENGGNRQVAHLTGDGEEMKLRGRKVEPASIPGLL